MTKKAFYRLLEQLALQRPQLEKEIEALALKVEVSAADWVDEAILGDVLSQYPSLAAWIRAHLQPDSSPQGKVFPVHKPYSEEILQRMRLAEHNEHYRNWANAVKAVPEFTLPLPDVDGAFIRRAKALWHEHICGNEAALQAILRHGIEYGRTGETGSILLAGEPGVGKTLAAKNYGRILGLPGSFISGPSASAGRGLSGAPNLYVGAGVGAVVQSMIDHGAGNPVICIDEIEKVSGGFGRSGNLHNELLAVLDESKTAWHDNFLEMEVDASHIPFIFTANEIDLIPAPLLDRMEVVRMEPPTQDMIRSIAKRFTLPKALKAYDSDRVEFGEQELDALVDLLWDSGNRSCRAYQKAVEFLVSNAYLDALENQRIVRITQQDVQNAAAMCAGAKRTRTIGFRL